VTSLTNATSADLPSEFFFRRYRTPVGEKPRADLPLETVLGTVTNVLAGNSGRRLLPEWKGVISIHDWRFTNK
jgi:hypothetical protein